MDLKKYEIPANIKNAIYILYDEDEVVYVGQTTNGLTRLLNHGNKKYNKFSFIEKEEEDLDYYEDLYIMKFQPKYNIHYNKYRMSFNSAYNNLKYNIKKNMNIFDFAEYIKKLNIETKKFKNINTITKKDFYIVNKNLEEIYGNK